MAELQKAGHLWDQQLTCNGRTVAANIQEIQAKQSDSYLGGVIRDFATPILPCAGLVHLTGNLFDSAMMKVSGISPAFQARYLENPESPNAFRGRAVVFEGPEDFRRRIDDDPGLDIDETSILVMRGCGPLGFPGAAETVNMRPPSRLIEAGVTALPCIGDGRQSGTSPSPSILNVSPEAAAGGNLEILRDGDVIRVDLNTRCVDVLISDDDLAQRRADLQERGGFTYPASQTAWQEMFREQTTQLDQGMVLRDAVKYQRVLARHPVPRHNH
jgi:dihydroxy-acid dehydratase